MSRFEPSNAHGPSTAEAAGPFMRFRRRVLTVLIAYWVALFIGTHIPLPQLEEAPPQSDKLLHFGAYVGLSFLLGATLGAFVPLTRRRMLAVIGAVAVYAVIDELLQIPVGRSCELGDAVADWLGAIAGGGAIGWLSQRVRNRSAAA